jgi:hypothetical protein
MRNRDRIVAIGLLTQQDVEVLGAGFKRLYPVDPATDFDDLLRAIDVADNGWKSVRKKDDARH